MTTQGAVARELRRLVDGYQRSQALHVVAMLRVSDLLAERPMTAAEIAAATGAHERSLARVLRALVTVGVYAVDDGRYSNTELGAALCSGAPGGAGEWARLIGRPYYWNTWSGLADTVRSGDNTFAALHGESVWQWRAKHPEEQPIFNEAMTGMTNAVNAAVAASYEWSRFAMVADVGGGHGALLAAVLSRHPAVRGVLFEQPHVIASAGEPLVAAGVADRCELVGGSFFDSVPPADAYVLKSVIHDWDDEESVAILRTCRSAAGPDGVLVLVEQLVDQAPDPVRTAFSDINMMVMPGGGERTTEEYAALLAAAGWTFTRAVPTGTDSFVLEAMA